MPTKPTTSYGRETCTPPPAATFQLEPSFAATCMRVIGSPNLEVDDGALSYVQLTSGERLIKVVHKQPGGFTLESYNRAYAPRYVALDDVKAVHRIAYIRTLR